jgi:hypothetical protein
VGCVLDDRSDLAYAVARELTQIGAPQWADMLALIAMLGQKKTVKPIGRLSLQRRQFRRHLLPQQEDTFSPNKLSPLIVATVGMQWTGVSMERL